MAINPSQQSCSLRQHDSRLQPSLCTSCALQSRFTWAVREGCVPGHSVRQDHLLLTCMVRFCTTGDRNRLDSFLRTVKQGFWSSSKTPSISTIAEDTLFNEITYYDYHIVQSYLPDRPDVQARQRCHNKTLIPKTVDLNDRDFLVNNVYKKNLLVVILTFLLRFYVQAWL